MDLTDFFSTVTVIEVATGTTTEVTTIEEFTEAVEAFGTTED